MKRLLWKVFGLAGLLVGTACGASTGLVNQGPHLPAREPDPARVKRPPPAVEVEVIPLRRNKKCFYVDGHHEPRGSDWKWIKGQWIVPPKGCYYAPPLTRYEKLTVGTTLVHRAGAWHPQGGKKERKCGAPQPCPAVNAH